MYRDCPEPRKEEDGSPNQAGEYARIQLNLAKEDAYKNLEGFELFLLGVEETINKPKMI